MPTRKDEAITSRPLWVAWIVPQVAGPNGIRHCRSPHWQAGMTRVGLLHAIGREETKGINCTSLQISSHD